MDRVYEQQYKRQREEEKEEEVKVEEEEEEEEEERDAVFLANRSDRSVPYASINIHSMITFPCAPRELMLIAQQ